MCWISDVWVPFMPCMTGSTWSNLNHCSYFYRLWAACRWWLVEAQNRSCYVWFNFSCLHSGLPTLHSGSSVALIFLYTLMYRYLVATVSHKLSWAGCVPAGDNKDWSIDWLIFNMPLCTRSIFIKYLNMLISNLRCMAASNMYIHKHTSAMQFR